MVIVILILLKINVWEIIREYFIRLCTHNHDRFTLTLELHDTDITYTTLHLLNITCTTLHLSRDIATVTLSRDRDTHYIHYLSLIFLILILGHAHWVSHYIAFALKNKINQAGVTGGDYSRENPGRYAWKGDPLWVWMPHVFLCLEIYARICYYILHDTWVQWTVSPGYRDPLTHTYLICSCPVGWGTGWLH